MSVGLRRLSDSLQPFPLCTFCEALTHQLRPGTAQVNRLRRSSYLAPLPFLCAPMDNNLPTPSLNVSPPVQPTSQSTYTLVCRRLSFYEGFTIRCCIPTKHASSGGGGQLCLDENIGGCHLMARASTHLVIEFQDRYLANQTAPAHLSGSTVNKAKSL